MMLTARALVVEVAVMLAVGAVLAAIGPFGSFELGSFPARLGYCLPAALAGYLFVRPTTLLATSAARRLGLPELPVIGAAVLIAAVPMVSFVLWLNGNRLGALPPLEGWFQLYVQIVLIGGLITMLFWLIEGRSRSAAAPPVQAPPSAGTEKAEQAAPPPPFLARLPAHLRSGLIALEMEDHYVRAHAADGSALVLMRMRDAIAELDGVEGLRVHRSWWVARAALKGVKGGGRSLRLVLEGGLEAPVARDNIAGLRTAGWLDAEV